MIIQTLRYWFKNRQNGQWDQNNRCLRTWSPHISVGKDGPFTRWEKLGHYIKKNKIDSPLST